MTDIRRMTVGQVVDFVIAYNERIKQGKEEKERPRKRRATQAEIDAFLG